MAQSGDAVNLGRMIRAPSVQKEIQVALLRDDGELAKIAQLLRTLRNRVSQLPSRKRAPRSCRSATSDS
jgi:hypothetical protein